MKSLKKLHSLSLLECGIEAIEIGTFSDLKQLTTLGLNFNSFQGFFRLYVKIFDGVLRI